MREIKVRFWLKESGKMSETYTLEELLDGGWYDIPEHETLQYTGLKDKNGKEIYEGDIVEYPRYRGSVQDGIYKEVIEWEVVPIDMLSPEHRAGFYIPERTSVLEIIGNIYENPELLK